jgi:predicted aspartyl protease
LTFVAAGVSMHPEVAAMGLAHVTARLTNVTGGGEAYEAEFLVDTGAIHSMALEDKLAAAGVAVEGKAVYELANGEPVEYKYGHARIAFMGEEAVSRVVFGPADAEPMLGAVALETVGIMVDPVTQTLKRLPALPLK